jgi:isopenicillin N synthase-like dioxygenase
VPQLDTAAIPVLSLASPAAEFATALGASFREFGFALVKDHGIDAQLIAQGWAMTQQLFAQDEATKRAGHRPEVFGARGYTPFRTEIAKDAKVSDLKEFWHVGRDLPAGHALSDSMPPNIWPAQPAGFADLFRTLYAAFDRAGATILSRLALDLGLGEHWFDPAIADGNSVLRLLHYPPVPPEMAQDGAIRAGAHGDINLITLLLGAQEAGLELLCKDGQWRGVDVPEGALVINIGDMLERLTNHVLPSTLHRVRNPDAERAGFSRYSMPFFLHLRSDFAITTLPACITPDNANRYPTPILADEFLQQRLREIGLKKG